MGHDVPRIETGDWDTAHTDQIPDAPPPAYGEHYGSVQSHQEGFDTKANVASDGRVNIRINQQSRKLSSLLTPALRQQQAIEEHEQAPPPPYIPPSLGGEEGVPPPPPMNIVIQVVGSRGDVQPFIALGKVLKDTYGNRVRLATHPVFESFVKEHDLEFFSIGGDPAKLMAFMVKNPGLMPGFETLRSGDIGDRRREVGAYIKGCWRSCYEAGDGLGPQASDKTIENWSADSADPEHLTSTPFVADCIIANPPSFAHIHCAEKLGIPLHIMFTMPYSPTQAFPHPLANIQSSNTDQHIANYMSYALIDMLTWQGLGDVINAFRANSLGLEPIELIWAPGMLQRLRVPHTYCWSPALIPKPKDWGQHISISGFFFLNLATNYTPAPDLQAFLDAGPPPVYIGFGSIVLDDPNAMTKLIFQAVERTGQRALVSKGWGGMGADELGQPEGVFMLGNVPHDWLFKHVSCVVHHGGAGTTAAGITAGRPTVVVPFFGDQQFWGSMVARAGAGPEPIPHKQLTADNLADAIDMCLKPESQQRAQELAEKIASERGSDVGAQAFHQYLDIDNLRCNLAPSRMAVWRVKRTQIHLSAMAACTLNNAGLLDFNDIKLFRSREYETDEGPWDPVTGGASALVGTMTQVMMGVADFPIETLKALKIHPDAQKKKKVAAQAEGDDDGDASSARTMSTDSKSLRGSLDGRTGRSLRSPDRGSSAVSSGEATPTTSRSNSTFNLQESLSRLQSPGSPISESGPVKKNSLASSMADALRTQLENKRARSSSRNSSPSRGHDRGDSMMDTGVGTAKGVGKIVGAGFTSPMDFTMGLTKGFHNAPKLYGDDTVRKHAVVTDFRSGVKAAGKEFGFGMYDGITGLVTQPMRGAKKDGAAGFFKGIGKGIGGIALKPGAALFGIPGYTMKGVYKEMQKQFGSSVQNYIIAARTAQGFAEWQGSSPEERADVVRRWGMLQKGLKKKRNPDEIVKDILEEQRKSRADAIATWKAEGGLSKFGRTRTGSSGHKDDARSRTRGHDPEAAMLSVGHGAQQSGTTATTTATAQPPSYPSAEPDDEDLAEAIRRSVQETSRGDPEEDDAVARAMQASMAELHRSRTQPDHTPDEDEHLRQAMEASTQHAPVHDEELERVLARSLTEQRRQHGSDSEWDSDNDDETDTRNALRNSQHPAMRSQQPPAYADAGHVDGTTMHDYESQQQQQSHTGNEKSQQEMTEEEVVLAYVKKQSLLEQEHRAKAAGKARATGTGAGNDDDDDDDDLRRALEMSMRRDGQDGEASGT